MAISNNILLKKMSGHIGREIVIRQYGDKTVISKFPVMKNRKFTERQLKAQAMMEEANYEAKRIMADPQLKMEAQVRLNVTNNKLYTSLIREYFNNAKKARH